MTSSFSLPALVAAGALLAAAPLAAQNVATLNSVQVFRSIDPHKMSDYADYMAAVNFYDALMTVEEGGELVPELAESWDVSEDAREITFHLRADATFANGTPVEAHDVVYSVERLLRINQGPAGLFKDVLAPGAVTAVDERTVKFTLAETFSPFLAMIPSIMILDEETVSANAGEDDGQTYLSNNVAGAGAYGLKSWDRGARLVMARNPDYYGGFRDNPIDEIRFIITNDESTVRALAASGELTMSSPFQAPDTYDAIGRMEKYEIVDIDSASVFYLKLNSKVAPTDDIHIRRAIALATDYETIREVIRPGAELRSPLPDAFADFVADDIAAPVYDLTAAQAEVDQSAYAGEPIPITLGYVAGGKVAEEISLLMQANLEQIGFTVTQEANPWNRVTDLATRVETTPAVNQIYFAPTYPSPDSMFYSQFHSDSAGTWASMEWLQDAEVDALIDRARATADAAEQAAIYRELQHKLVDIQSDVYVFAAKSQMAVDKCFDGFRYVPMQSVPYDFTRYSWTCN
jgi:peptide/nickel transport system substrate-binding protein